MSELVLLTSTAEPPGEILPALALLLHTVRTGPAEAGTVTSAPAADAVLVDARRDLVRARELCRLLRTLALDAPTLVVVTEGGLAAVTAEWGFDDVLLHTAEPAEVEARLRLATGRQASLTASAPDEIRSGDLAIDEATYTARLRNRALDLTFKEFELLKFLAQHPGRVFTRAHLLQEVWGYDYFGGTRTVDVHVRRLRAKLGPEHEALIGTVRNVGYRFVPLKVSEDGRRAHLGGRDSADRTLDGLALGTGSPARGTGHSLEPGSGHREAAGHGPDTRPVPEAGPVTGTGLVPGGGPAPAAPVPETGPPDRGNGLRLDGQAGPGRAAGRAGPAEPAHRTAPARAAGQAERRRPSPARADR